ncbi:uncharacterized protein LOC123693461 isoform X1 [Colias croceus]|uniref:uncharacterized protein LOC123693461 isoform X1 n=1 Tax=Colias crocea TaxID=72248 RepID=UPI001E280AC1|nr:uncharacterized protein LOC123693461 isoform X1 [Colias croceus]
MYKLLIFCALWSISHGAYMSRMSSISRFRGPTAFRPGFILQRPNMFPPRMMPAASHRTPFVVYRNLPHRYAMKPMPPVTTRNVFGIPWKTTARLPVPVPVTPDYDYARTAASAQPVIRNDGAIHTIPAPNLSLSEKPIVVAEVLTSEAREANTAEGGKPTYEVTEKVTENHSYDVQAKIEAPTGFYKPDSGVNYEFKNVNNEAPQQYNQEYGLIQVQQQMSSIIPQEFTVQRYNGLPSHQDLIHSGAEGIIIPPTALLQSDPLFLQKLQTQLLQRYPAVEFIPYNPEIQSQIPSHNQEPQAPSYYSQNEHFIKQAPMAFVPSDGNRNIVQRETQEGTVQSLSPESFIPNNITETPTVVTTTNPPETTISNVVTDPQTTTTTTERIEVKSENDRSNPAIYYSQMGQTVNSAKANSFYSAINDIKEISPKEEIINKNFDKGIVKSESTTIIATTQEPDTTHYLDSKDKPEANEIIHVYKNFIASPFEKPAESVNIVYSLLRRTTTAPTVDQNVTITTTTTTEKPVETTANATKDNQRERSFLNRQPIRFTLTDKRSADGDPQQVVKAKIPPKSKLIFDDKTGEPILRVYASYVDNPARKEAITQKLTNMRHLREVPKKPESPERFDAATVNALASDVNNFGQKIKSRNDAARQILLDEYN